MATRRYPLSPACRRRAGSRWEDPALLWRPSTTTASSTRSTLPPTLRVYFIFRSLPLNPNLNPVHTILTVTDILQALNSNARVKIGAVSIARVYRPPYGPAFATDIGPPMGTTGRPKGEAVRKYRVRPTRRDNCLPKPSGETRSSELSLATIEQ